MPVSSLRMRPTFERYLSCSPSEAVDVLETHLEATAERGYTGEFYTNHALINVPEDEQWFWSPQLTLDFEAENGGTRIRGMYGPGPSVWTMFMAMYAIAAFVGSLGLLVGLTQWSINMTATGLWAVPASGALAAFTYGLALAGQALSRDQMDDLRAYASEALNEADIQVSRAPAS